MSKLALFLAAGIAVMTPPMLIPPALAQSVGHVCTVNEPNGNPLPMRAVPRGVQIDSLTNGTRVTVQEIRPDDRGLPWARVSGGWVYASYLNCSLFELRQRNANQ
jgi:hypothetical protein